LDSRPEVRKQLVELFCSADPEQRLRPSNVQGSDVLTHADVTHRLDKYRMKMIMMEAGLTGIFFDQIDSNLNGEAQVEEILANMDDDGNGNLGLDEFLRGCLPASGSSTVWKGVTPPSRPQAKANNTSGRGGQGGGRRGGSSLLDSRPEVRKQLVELFCSADPEQRLRPSNVQGSDVLTHADVTHRLDKYRMKMIMMEAGLTGIFFDQIDSNLNGEAQVEEILANMDDDGNGNLGLDEFLRGCLPASGSSTVWRGVTPRPLNVTTSASPPKPITISRRRGSIQEFSGFDEPTFEPVASSSSANNTSWGFGQSEKSQPASQSNAHSSAGAQSRHGAAPPGRVGAWTTWNPAGKGGAKAEAPSTQTVRRRGGAAKVAGTDKDSREIETRLKKTYDRAEKSRGKKTGTYIDPVRAFTATQMDFRVGYIQVENAIGKLKSFNPGARTSFPFATTVADHWRENSSACGRDGKMTVRDWLKHVDPLETVSAAIQGSFDV